MLHSGTTVKSQTRTARAALTAGAATVVVTAAALGTGSNPLGDSDGTGVTDSSRSLDNIGIDPEGRFSDPHFTEEQKQAMCHAMEDASGEFLNRDVTTLDFDEPMHRPTAHCGISESWEGEEYNNTSVFMTFHEHSPEEIEVYESKVVSEIEEGHAHSTDRSECWMVFERAVGLTQVEKQYLTERWKMVEMEFEAQPYCTVEADQAGMAAFFTTHQTLVAIEIKWPDEVLLNDEDHVFRARIYADFLTLRTDIVADVFDALP